MFLGWRGEKGEAMAEDHAAPALTADEIATLERVGLIGAVKCVCELLDDPDGEKKHGSQGWKKLSDGHLLDKILSHTPPTPAELGAPDEDSGKPTAAHLASRALMALQAVLGR